MSQADVTSHYIAHLGVASSQLFVIYAVGVMSLNAMIQQAGLGVGHHLAGLLGTKFTVEVLPQQHWLLAYTIAETLSAECRFQENHRD